MIMRDGHLSHRLSSGEYFGRRVNVPCVKKNPNKKSSGNSSKKKTRRGVKRRVPKCRGDKYLRLPSHYDNIIHYDSALDIIIFYAEITMPPPLPLIRITQSI